jgi:hypothetical protein
LNMDCDEFMLVFRSRASKNGKFDFGDQPKKLTVSDIAECMK